MYLTKGKDFHSKCQIVFNSNVIGNLRILSFFLFLSVNLRIIYTQMNTEKRHSFIFSINLITLIKLGFIKGDTSEWGMHQQLPPITSLTCRLVFYKDFFFFWKLFQTSPSPQISVREAPILQTRWKPLEG